MDPNRAILFFDDRCNFCLKMVKTLSQTTRSKKLYYAPFFGKTAQKIIGKKKHPSVIYYNPTTHQKAYRMKAVCLALSHRYPIFKVLSSIAFVLDPFYVLIARLRIFFPLRKQRALKGPSVLP